MKLKMATGTVKWFNPAKGYGFVQPDDGSKDVFIHISNLEEKGLSDLQEDQKISYDTENNKGKISATNIELIS
ncbi:cold-shock protein [Rickettsiales bacterium]|nr:cold-shock protein [Rickettsiales bacterium]